MEQVDDAGRGEEGGHDAPPPHAPRPPVHYTPTGEPCPRTVRVDGTVDGEGHCHGCGFCLLLMGLD